MKRKGHLIGAALAVFGIIPFLSAAAQPRPPTADRPIVPLTGLHPPAPQPSALYNAIVKDTTALVALGKALFWDTQVATANGQACASCHFHAGADSRAVNQLSPGLNVQGLPPPPQFSGDITFGGTSPPSPSGTVGKTGSGNTGAANITLAPGDFPFHRLEIVNDRESRILYDTNDVASSQGSFQGGPVTLPPNIIGPLNLRNACASTPGAPFAINANGTTLNTRKVEPRNTPTAINAVFNHRNFWDGRANNVFNGVNPFGRRAIAADPTVVVYQKTVGTPQPQPLMLQNMSAASQAVGPVLSSFEMTCNGKKFADVGRRLLTARVLINQLVAKDDSVFEKYPGAARISVAGGISQIYRDFVQAAFQPAYWNDSSYYTVNITTGLLTGGANAATGYRIDELNFSMFFGIAVDAYERTLISNQTPFDSPGGLDPNSDAGKGQALFAGKANCVACHDGPLFSKATTFQEDTGNNAFHPVERMPMAVPTPALYDDGFYNIGVRPTFEDLGVGGTDPWNNPLSFTRQFVREPFANRQIGVDQFTVDPCKFEILFDSGTCAFVPSDLTSHRIAVDGAFKVPTLRNVALTPPYFHNGGQSNLADVVRFYNRGGDRRSLDNPPSERNDTTGTGPLGRPVVTFPGNPPVMSPAVGPNMGGSNADPDITTLGLTDIPNGQGEVQQIVAFLQALTDPRVACHKAPFDHPALPVPNGQRMQDLNLDRNADDIILAIKAVGKNGYTNCNFATLNAGNLFISTPAVEAMVK